jgi:hypothetical protein
VSLDLDANITIDRALSALRVHCFRFSKLFTAAIFFVSDRIDDRDNNQLLPLFSLSPYMGRRQTIIST